MTTPRRSMILVLAATLASTAFAVENTPDARQELDSVRAQLETEQKRLSDAETQFSATQSNLKKIETEISRATAVSRRIERDAATAQEQLNKLNVSSQRLEQQHTHQRDILAREMTTQYLTRGDKTLRLWLGDTDAVKIGQLLTYHDYVSTAWRERIAATKAALDTLTQNRREIAEKQNELATLKAQQTEELRKLERSRSQRQTLLASLAKSAAQSRNAVAELEVNAQRLEDLLTQLRRSENRPRAPEVSSAPVDFPRAESFAKRKGLLPWPVNGKIARNFGAQRSNAGAKYRGVVIDATAGESVRAIAPGRVVFADWLRGFGLLLILDHGDGFFSLYGHNEALLRDVGDHVDESQVIATVGASGGQTTSGLYFEIRHKGKPINPSQWCNDRG